MERRGLLLGSRRFLLAAERADELVRHGLIVGRGIGDLACEALAHQHLTGDGHVGGVTGVTGVLDMRIGDAVDGLLAVVAYGVVAGLGLVDRRDVLGVGHRVVMHRLVGDRPVVFAGLFVLDLLLLDGRGAGAGSCGRAALPAGQVDAAGDETGDEQGTRRDTEEDAALGLDHTVGGGLRFLSVVQTVLVIHGCPPFWDRAGAPHLHGRSARSMCSGLGLGVARDIAALGVAAFIGCGILCLRGAAVLDAVVGAAAREHGECRDGDHGEEVVAAGLAEEPAGRRGGHGDRLPLIVDVLVLGDQNLGGLVALLGLLVQLLEHHEVVAVEGGGIELAEVDVDGAVLAVGRELEFGGDVLVVDGQHLAGLLVHKRRLEGVFLARNQALVGHAVGDYRILTGHQRVVAVGLVRGGGADDGGHEVHGLLLGVEVAFGGDDDGGGTLLIRDRVLGHDLEHHDVLGLAAEAVDDIVGVEVEVHGHGAVVLLRGELGGLVDQMGDEVFVVADELAEGIHVDGHRQLAGGGVVEHDAGVLEHGHVGDGFLLLIGQGIVAHLARGVHGSGGQTIRIGLIGGVDDLEGAVRMDAHGLGLLHRTVLGGLIKDHDVGDTLILILRGESEHVEELLHERRDIRLGVLLAAIARENGKAGLGIHEDTGHGVTDAGQGVLVGHIIGDGGLRIRDDVLVPIETVGGRGGDARHMSGRGLLAVLDVGVGHKLDAVLLKALECDHLGVLRDAGGVEGEGHLDLAVGLLGGEGGLCGDGLAVHLKSLLRDVALLVGHLHMEAALQGVGLAGDDVLVLHGVDNRGLAVGHDVLIAVMAVQRGSADLLAVSGVKVVSAVTGLPSTSRGSAVKLPSSSDFFTCMEPFKVYSLPGMRPEYFTVSTMTVSSSVTMFLSPSMPSSAEVVMNGCLTVTVCALSLMSAWAAISTPFFSRDSKATISVSWGMVRELKWNTTSTLPSAFSGVKVVSALMGLPSTSRGFSVTLPSSSVTFTWRMPFKV